MGINDNKEEFLRRIQEAHESLQNKAVTVVSLKIVIIIILVLLFAHIHRENEPIPQNLGGTTPLEFGK